MVATMKTDTRKKDGPIVAGREQDAVAASQRGGSKDNDISASVEEPNSTHGKPEVDLASWATLGGKSSHQRHQKKEWKRSARK